MPVIIPPITSQYLNLIKNSSFGAAIAYPEIVACSWARRWSRPARRSRSSPSRLAIYLTHQARRVGLHELVQCPPSAGDAMTAARHYARAVTGWSPLRQRLFATPLDAAITLVCLYIVWRISVPLVHWLLLDATWHGTSRDDCKGTRRLLGVRPRALQPVHVRPVSRARALARRPRRARCGCW